MRKRRVCRSQERRKPRLRLTLLAALGLFSVVAQAASGFHFTPPRGWTEGASFLRMRTWTEAGPAQPAIIISEDESAPGAVPETEDRVLVQHIAEASRVPNLVAGISQWQVERVERTRVGKAFKVVLVGTYMDAHHQRVHFEEWKFYGPSGFSQISYRETSSRALRTRAQVASILERYQPFGT